MFSAVFLLKFNETLTDAAKNEFVSSMEELASEVSAVSLVKPLLMGSVPASDLYVEMGFPDQAAYEEAKKLFAWKKLDMMANDSELVAAREFVAFGEGKARYSDEEAKAHRLLIFHAYPDTPEALKEKMEDTIVKFIDYVPGLVNCKIAKVVECSGNMDWSYAFECDYDVPTTYLGAYLATPYHWAYIDKYFDPAATATFFIDPNLCSVYCEADNAFLANYRD